MEERDKRGNKVRGEGEAKRKHWGKQGKIRRHLGGGQVLQCVLGRDRNFSDWVFKLLDWNNKREKALQSHGLERTRGLRRRPLKWQKLKDSIGAKSFGSKNNRTETKENITFYRMLPAGTDTI